MKGKEKPAKPCIWGISERRNQGWQYNQSAPNFEGKPPLPFIHDPIKQLQTNLVLEYRNRVRVGASAVDFVPRRLWRQQPIRSTGGWWCANFYLRFQPQSCRNVRYPDLHHLLQRSDGWSCEPSASAAHTSRVGAKQRHCLLYARRWRRYV